MKSTRYKLFAFVTILGFLISLFFCSHKQGTKRILIFAYYSADTTDGTKVFELNSDGSILFKTGIRDSKNVSIEPLKQILAMKRYSVESKDFAEIKYLIKRLNECGNMNVQHGSYNDVFEVMIRTDTVRINRLMIGTKSECDAIISDVCGFFNKFEFL